MVSDAIECSLCLEWAHRKCVKLSKKDLLTLSDDGWHWHCTSCTAVFPFAEVNQDEFQFMFIGGEMSQNKLDLFKKCRDIELEYFEYNDYNISDKRSNVIQIITFIAV